MKLGACVCQRTKRKLKKKNKRTPCMPVVKNLGLVFVYPRTHSETKQRKKKGPILGTFEFPV
jgi:hypothetical protein